MPKTAAEMAADDYERRMAEAGGTEKVVAGLVEGFKRQKRILRWLVFTVITDVVLSLALGAFGLIVANTVARANENSDALRSQAHQSFELCLSGNEARATEKTLWEFILRLPPTQGLSKAQQQQQQQQRKVFRAFLDRKLAPRTCTETIGGKTDQQSIYIIGTP